MQSTRLRLILLFLGIGIAAPCSASPITYSINQTFAALDVPGAIGLSPTTATIGPITVTVDIVTDGTIGTLNESDIIGWSVSLVDNQPVSICHLTTGLPCQISVHDQNGTPPPTVAGTDLSATATQLLFNFSGTDNGFFDFGVNGGNFCFQTKANDCFTPAFGAGELVNVTIFADPSLAGGNSYWSGYIGNVYISDWPLYYTNSAGTDVIAAVSSSQNVPEPTSMALLGFGVFCVGMIRRRSCKVASQLPVHGRA